MIKSEQNRLSRNYEKNLIKKKWIMILQYFDNNIFNQRQFIMQLNQNENKKIIAIIKSNLTNLINNYPINKSQLKPLRNLAYIIFKQSPPEIQQLIQQLKTNIKSTDLQTKLIAIKMLYILPLSQKIKFIDNHQNDLLILLNSQQYHFQIITSINDFMIDIYLLIKYNYQLYAASISRIISFYNKAFQLLFSNNKQQIRNAFELLRCVCDRIKMSNDKLIQKVISLVEPRLQQLFIKLYNFEIRLRVKLYNGFVWIFSKIGNRRTQLFDKLIKELLIVISNLYQYEPIIQSIQNISILLKQISIPWYLYNQILQNCFTILTSLSTRKQYLPSYLQLLKLSQNSNNRLKYAIALKFLQISSKNFQYQYTRLVIMKLSLKNLLTISSTYKNKKYSIIMSIFNQKWFVTKIKEDHQLFRQQFLLSLISEYFEGQPNPQVKDILDICNRLLDWNCNMKNPNNVQTIKYTFDLYLRFLKDAYLKLGKEISPYLQEIITRINEQNIYFLFKMKILTLLAGLLSYQQLTKDLKIDFLQGQLRPFMMPKNPKQIFTNTYARTNEGIIQTAKQIQYIKNIMNLLSVLSNIYSELTMQIDNLIAQYHDYLTKLEQNQWSNKNLISILLQLGDEPIITEVSKNFLLSIYHKVPQLAIYNYPYISECSFLNRYQQSIFPTYSPVDVSVCPYNFVNGKLTLGINTFAHISIGQAFLTLTTPSDFVQVSFQSTIIQIKLQCPGLINIEVVTQSGNIIGKTQYKVLINWNWKRIDWYNSFDYIKLKVFWQGKGFTAKYLGLYWGQPVCIGFEQQSTQLTLFVSSKQILNGLMNDLQNILDNLSEGNLILKS